MSEVEDQDDNELYDRLLPIYQRQCKSMLDKLFVVFRNHSSPSMGEPWGRGRSLEAALAQYGLLPASVNYAMEEAAAEYDDIFAAQELMNDQ